MKLPPLKRVGFSQEMLSFIAIALDQSLELPSWPYGLAGQPFATFELSLIVCVSGPNCSKYIEIPATQRS